MNDDRIRLSKTKITVPARRPELLSRERLLDLLYELLDKKITLVTAPAGYGKTSLLIDMAYQVEIPVCWLSLDVLDQEPQRFYAYFIAALQHQFPEFGRQSQSILGALTSEHDGIENLLLTIVNDILENIPTHFALVLDDYQFIDGVLPIRQFINRFLQIAPENCHIILASRALITIPDLALLIVRDEVGGISYAELMFNAEEIRALFEQKYQRKISVSRAETLALQTEGWITGLQLTTLAAQEHLNNHMRVMRATGISLFEYLSHEVLNQQTQTMQDFLLLTSLFDEFNPEICRAVLGPLDLIPAADWDQLVNMVVQFNLFALPVGQEAGWLRYHHLFQEFLQEQLKKEKPEIVPAIRYQLANYFEKSNDWESAFQVYKDLGDLLSLSQMIARAGSYLIQNDRIITLVNWLNEIPAYLIFENPALLSHKGTLAIIQANIQEGLTCLDSAVEKLSGTEENSDLALALVRRSSAHRLSGAYEQAIQDAEEAIRIAKQTSLTELVAESHRMKGLSFYRMGRNEEAIKHIEQASNIFTSINRQYNQPMVQMEMGIVYHAMAMYPQSKAAYQKAYSIWKQSGNFVRLSNLLNSLGISHHYQGEYAEAVNLFEEGLRYAQNHGFTRIQALLLTSMGDLYSDLVDYAYAKKTYQTAYGIAQTIADQFLITYLSIMLSEMARQSGDFSQAKAALSEIHPHIEKQKSLFEKGLFHLQQGRVAFSQENYQDAETALRLATALFEQGGFALEHIIGNIWLAASLAQQGKHELAGKTVEDVFSGTLSEPLITAAVPQISKVQKLLPPIFSQNTPDHIVKIFQRTEQFKNELPGLQKILRETSTMVPKPPAKIIIKGFGNTSVSVDQQTLSSKHWQSQSAKDLLFFFLAADSPVSKETIGNAFWPDLSPAKLKLRYKNLLYRLRQALGQDIILFENNTYTFNHELDYEYDVRSFEKLIERAQATNDTEHKLSLLKRAAGLVKGPYLQDIDALWVESERERLRQRFITALLKIIEIEIQQGNDNEALVYCRTALDQEPFMEEIHRLIMQLHHQRGDRAAAILQYQQLQTALEKELGIPPSPATTLLVEKIKSA